MSNMENASNKKMLKFGFVAVLALIVGGIIFQSNDDKEQRNKLQSEMQSRYAKMKSDCKTVSKEKQYQTDGTEVFIEKFTCDDGVVYSFINPGDYES